MPKLKTHSGVKKRFKITAGGKIKKKKTSLRHLLSHKSRKRKSRLSRPHILGKAEAKKIRKLLPR